MAPLDERKNTIPCNTERLQYLNVFTLPKNLLSVGIKCSGHTLSKYHLNPLHFRRSLNSSLVRICCSSRTFSASAKITNTVSKTDRRCSVAAHALTRVEFEVKLFPLVHPHQSHSCQIRVQHAGHASGKRVRRRFTKHVSDMRTRGYFDATAALPDLCFRVLVVRLSKKRFEQFVPDGRTVRFHSYRLRDGVHILRII